MLSRRTVVFVELISPRLNSFFSSLLLQSRMICHSPYVYSISKDDEQVQSRLIRNFPISKPEIERLWFVKWDEEHASGIERCFLVAMPIDDESI